MKGNEFELIIFDFDGVLVDSEFISCEIDALLLTRAGIPISTSEVVTRFMGATSREMYRVLEFETGVKLPPNFHNDVRQRILEEFDKLSPMSGSVNVLNKIKKAKCVASNSERDRLYRAITAVGLNNTFMPHVYSADDVSKGKPAPDLFLYVANRFGVAPELCLVIEDSVSGIQAASAANMVSIGFCGGTHCSTGHAELLACAGAAKVMHNWLELGAFLNVGL